MNSNEKQSRHCQLDSNKNSKNFIAFKFEYIDGLLVYELCDEMHLSILNVK